MQAGGVILAGLAGARLVHGAGSVHTSTVDIYMRSDNSGSDVWFDPIGVFIEPGQSVRWISEHNVHTTTAYHPNNAGRPLRIPKDATPWDSGYLMNEGDSFTIALTVEGVYDYLCIPHEAAGMVGRLVVGDPKGSPAPEFGDAIPKAARSAFPSVSAIVRDGLVRR